MKKYRYLKPATPLRKTATFMYFFIGWNIIGFIGYQMWKKTQMERDPEFEKLSDVDIYLRMTRPNTSEKDLKVITIKGLHVHDQETD